MACNVIIRAFIKRLKQPVLNNGPEIWTDNSCVYARTPWIVRLSNLFCYSRFVVADRRKKQIELTVTTFWFKKSKEDYPVNEIEYIDISEREILNAKGYAMDMNEKSGFGGRKPTLIYYVQLRTKSTPYPVNLIDFVDEGGWDLGGLGVFTNDSVIEPEGPQKQKADSYAELLSDFIGVKLWRDRHVQFDFDPNKMRECSQCGHRIRLSASRCTYCGHVDGSAVHE